MLDGFLRRTGAPGRIAWDGAARRTSLLRTTAIFALGFPLCGTLLAAGGGNAAGIEGVVTDPTGAVVPGATVEIQNPVSKLERSATTDAGGHFSEPRSDPAAIPSVRFKVVIRTRRHEGALENLEH